MPMMNPEAVVATRLGVDAVGVLMPLGVPVFARDQGGREVIRCR